MEDQNIVEAPIKRRLMVEAPVKTAPVAVVVDDGGEFLEELDNFEETKVHPEDFEMPNGSTRTFLVKEFTQDDHLEVALGPLTFVSNEYVKKPRIEAKLSVALKIHRGLVKRTGKDKKGRPTYTPVFTVPQIEAMYDGNQKGLFLDWALAQVHKHNPKTNPLKKKAPEPETKAEPTDG